MSSVRYNVTDVHTRYSRSLFQSLSEIQIEAGTKAQKTLLEDVARQRAGEQGHCIDLTEEGTRRR